MEINEKPECYVFDLDGTITDRRYIPKYNNDVDFENEYCQEFVCKVFESLEKQGYKMIVLTGRSEKHRIATLGWLVNRHILPDQLILRPITEQRSGIEFKLAWLKKLEEEFRIVGIFEDRRKYVEVFRKADYKVFDVADNIF